MTLKTYLIILWRRKSVLAATIVIVLAVVLLGSLSIQPTYQAVVKLQVSTAPRGSLDFVDYNMEYTDRMMNTYIHVAQSGPIMDELVRRFGLQESPQIDVAILANTELMRITATATDATLASRLANTLAEMLVTRSEETAASNSASVRLHLEQQIQEVEVELNGLRRNYDTQLAKSPRDAERIVAISREIESKKEIHASLTTQYEQVLVREILQANKLSIIDPATPPKRPANPNLLLNTALGLLLGLVAGLGFAFLFENLDGSLQFDDQIEKVTQLSLLGKIPLLNNLQWPALLTGDSGPFVEAFARLYANIQAHTNGAPANIILVTSAQEAEGKSTVVAGLASLLAKGGMSVVVVDCNLRSPTMHKVFRVSNNVGVSTILTGQTTLQEALQTTIMPHLKVLPSGPNQNGLLLPMRLPDLKELLQTLKRQGMTILLDAPAYLTAAETVSLVALADGAVLVVGRKQARLDAAHVMRRELGDLHTKLFGTVINRAEPMYQLSPISPKNRSTLPMLPATNNLKSPI